MSLTLSFACPPYDRILPLAHGTVIPEGIQLNYLSLEVEEIFWRQLRNQEFDVSESSLSSYVMLRSRGDDRFIAVHCPGTFLLHKWFAQCGPPL